MSQDIPIQKNEFKMEIIIIIRIIIITVLNRVFNFVRSRIWQAFPKTLAK